ncbi:MAG: preprotein translocase subunit SecE [Hyphomonadaceae bacterium]|nr:preprotein translocase subunit SecE [Hyphomonadaceae bacterium]
MTTDAADREASEPKRGKGPGAFLGEVRAEARKVTWATRQEVIVSSIMVAIMVSAAALFFFIVDAILRWVVAALLGLN